ncbi:MAG: transporter [Spirochaetes bacterium]|nr:transporter [Spirochaetota bacterium]
MKKAVSTVLFLLKIMVPTSLAVALLGWSGLLGYIAAFLAPLMRLIGLPGEAALVFISGALLNIYSAIAVMGTLSLTLKHATILAIMSLTAHNLIVETTVMKSLGSSALKMTLLRILTAIFIAFVFNLILPARLAGIVFSSGMAAQKIAFLPMLGSWALSTLKLVGKIIFFVLVIMETQSLFEEFRIMDFLSRFLAPFMKIFGLPADTSFLWIVINIVGYAYGAGIIKSEYETGKLKKQDGDLFNHHAGICHSLLEDTFLYAAISVPIFWITVPRLILAIAVVWLERFRRSYFKRSFRVGTV